MAKNVYHEARGETLVGQIAVIVVTLNRVRSSRYPNTVCKVVHQKYQFSWTNAPTRIYNWKLYFHLRSIARQVHDNKVVSIVGAAMFYHSKEVNPKWNAKMNKVATIGQHIFYEG